ncbi:transposase [Ottowia sp.]|uniref:REP-associated tyrosine transposase n=1 Tax=Ottowia sp. TaxID=1898956 RepID=UPI002B953E30|nr:transposase [Ottowia sp.]HRN76222.1 transposase [Ottowia sp.]HRQ02251.1 transposase [Ottowia sp.]
MLARSSALRRGRFSHSGYVYLVTTITRERQPVFADFLLARLAITELRRSDDSGRCKTLAYVLMPDHLHWLLRLEQGTLSQTIGSFKAHAARAVQRQRSCAGQPLWQAGYHDHALRRDEDLRTAARYYLVANPVRAGLVERVGDYPHWNAVWM